MTYCYQCGGRICRTAVVRSAGRRCPQWRLRLLYSCQHMMSSTATYKLSNLTNLLQKLLYLDMWMWAHIAGDTGCICSSIRKGNVPNILILNTHDEKHQKFILSTQPSYESTVPRTRSQHLICSHNRAMNLRYLRPSQIFFHFIRLNPFTFTIGHFGPR